MHQSFEEAVNVIMERHNEYAPDAYDFLRQAINAGGQLNREKETRRHLSAEELYMKVCILALEEFGPLARTVLNFWGINHSLDIGNIVFNLIEVGVFGKQEDDSIEQFRHLPKLSQLLDAPYVTQN